MIRSHHSPPVIVGVCALLFAACSESTTFSPTPPPPNAAFAIASMMTCGASFRMISSEHDALMDQYGLPSAVDTVDVCEEWTGSDYNYQAVAVGSSENIPGFTDTVQTIAYQGGSVTGYSADGAAASNPTSVGPTAFDYLHADAATRQASYDYPYYGVYSPDPNACTQPPCLETSVGVNSAQPTLSAGASVVGGRDTIQIPSGNYVKHGLSRRGVRALVDNAVEIAPSLAGLRRFRSINGSQTIVRSIDPKSQLLMIEELTESAGTMRATHAWARVAGGYVRSHSEYVSTEKINGKELKSAAKIVFQNVKVRNGGLSLPGAQGITP